MIKVTLAESKIIKGLTKAQKKDIKESLTFDNPKYESAMIFGRANPQYCTIPQFIHFYEKRGTSLVVPLKYEIPFKHTVVRDNRVKVKVSYPCPLLGLRKDQSEAVTAYINKQPNELLLLPTGAGKTILGLYLAYKLKQKVLILVNRVNQLDVWVKDAMKLFGVDKSEIGIIHRQKQIIGKQITIATIQTLFINDLESLKDTFGMVILDECHHVKCETYRDVLSRFKAFYKVGLTATLEEETMTAQVAKWYLGDYAYCKTESKDITPLEVRIIPTKFDRKRRKVKEKDGTYRYVEPSRENLLRQVINDRARNDLIMAFVSEAYKQGRNCVVFTHRREHAKALQHMLRIRYRVPAELLIGDVKNQPKILADCEKGKVRCVVATFHLIKEAINVTSWDRGFGVTDSANKTELTQAAGRIRRAKRVKRLQSGMTLRIPEFLSISTWQINDC